ncbi:MAG: hypothetical protein OXF01_07470 [Gemmatimonadetes bacterium]|nr:hypothetical protein [Gemmatimonadota bacterium]
MSFTALALALAVALIPAGAHAQEIIDLPGEDRLLEVETEQVFIGQLNTNGWRTLGPATRFLRWIRRSADTSGGARATLMTRIAFDAQGRLHILDPGALDPRRWRIFVVDPEGDVVREYEAGEGDAQAALFSSRPAEFVVASDGRTVVADRLKSVVRTYSPEGALEREMSFAPADIFEGSTAPNSSRRTTEAVLTVRDAAGERTIERILLAGRSIERHPVASVWRAPEEEEGASAGVAFSLDRDTADSDSDWQYRPAVPPIQRFVPTLRYDVFASGGIAFVDSSTYAVKLMGTDGQVSRILRRPLRPRPVTEEVRLAEMERLREVAQSRVESLRDMTDPDDFRRVLTEAIEEAYFYPEISPILSLRTTWEGSLWVRRSGEEPGGPGGPIDVLSPDGQYLGTFDPEELGDLGSRLISGQVAFGPDGLVAYVEPGWQESLYVVVKRLPEEVR